MPPEYHSDRAHEPDLPTTDQPVEMAADVIGRHQYEFSSRSCRCEWRGSPAEHAGHVAQRLAIVGALRSGGLQ
jgi:hypothetical protein